MSTSVFRGDYRIVGVVVTGDTITGDEALLVLLGGVILWLTGVILTGMGNREDE